MGLLHHVARLGTCVVALGCLAASSPLEQDTAFASTTVTTVTPRQDGNLLLFSQSGLADLRYQWLHYTCTQDTQRAITSILNAANKALQTPLLSVTQKEQVIPKGATAHDYVTMAKYYWPDPKHPHGSYILRDGYTDPEGTQSDKYDETRKSQFVNAVNQLSLAYALSGDERYANKAASMLRTWFITPSTRMNPNLNFAQGIPGKTTGSPGGIIDSVPFIQITDDVRMLESSQAWTSRDDDNMRTWFGSYLTWLLTSANGRQESLYQNNQGTWYDAQVVAYALFTGKKDVAQCVARSAEQMRIVPQIEPNGTMPKEVARSKSLAYSIYNLQAFVTLARGAEEAGVNLWNYQSKDGCSIQKAVNYMVPYITKQAKWNHTDVSGASYRGLARYLALAHIEYGNSSYVTALQDIVPNENAEERISAQSFMDSNDIT